MILDYTPLQGFMVPVVVAKQLGYYRDAGLDVSIDLASSSTTAIQQVDSGQATLGYTDVGKAALAVAEGAKVKAVAVYMQKNQGVVISRTSEGITSPKALIGKSVGTTTGSSSQTDLLAMLAANGISPTSIKLESVASASKIDTFLAGKVDAITGFLGSECVQVKSKLTQPVTCMLDSDFGVSSLGEGIIVTDQTLASNPSLVKALLNATNRGWAYALAHPAEAASIAQKVYPLTDASLLQAQFSASKALIHTSASQGCTIGWMAPTDWSGTVQFLQKYSELNSSAIPTTFYSNVLACK